MSLLIATPMYAGLCQAPYFQSCMALKESLLTAGLKHDWLVTTNESLVTRARNTQASTFWLRTDYEALLFIDGDIDFTPDDVAKLWNLGEDVACAAYAMKREAGGVTAWKDGRLVDLDDFVEPTPVDYAGTGFLMIRRAAFARLAKAHPELRHMEGNGEVWGFFSTFITDDADWKERFFVSEDYAFCERWRALGGKIWLEPSIRLGHWGVHRYG